MIDFTATEATEDEHVCDRDGYCGCAEDAADAERDYNWD